MGSLNNRLWTGIYPNISCMTAKKSSRLVLAKNLNALMADTPGLESNPKLAKRSTLGLGTIGRARNADVAVTVDTLDALAACFYLESWQLIMDDLTAPVTGASAPAGPELTAAGLKMGRLFDAMVGEAPDPEFVRLAIDAACQAINALDAPPSPPPSGKRVQPVKPKKLAS